MARGGGFWNDAIRRVRDQVDSVMAMPAHLLHQGSREGGLTHQTLPDDSVRVPLSPPSIWFGPDTAQLLTVTNHRDQKLRVVNGTEPQDYMGQRYHGLRFVVHPDPNRLGVYDLVIEWSALVETNRHVMLWLNRVEDCRGHRALYEVVHRHEGVLLTLDTIVRGLRLQRTLYGERLWVELALPFHPMSERFGTNVPGVIQHARQNRAGVLEVTFADGETVEVDGSLVPGLPDDLPVGYDPSTQRLRPRPNPDEFAIDPREGAQWPPREKPECVICGEPGEIAAPGFAPFCKTCEDETR